MAFNITILNNENCAALDKEFYLELINFPTSFIWSTVVLNSILAITATLGNGVIIVAILRSQHLRTPSYLLITSLAFTDLLVGLVFHPFQSVTYLFYLQKNIHAICALSNPYKFLFVLLAAICLLVVTCISIDRYLALTLRHRYPIVVTKKRVLLVTVASWILALILAILVTLESVYGIVFIIGYCLCLGLMFTTCVLYIKSFRALHLYTVQVHAQQPNPLAGNFDVVRYKKTLKTMVLVLACLLLCVVPLTCSLIAKIVFGFSQKEVVFFFLLSLTLLCLNSSINPVIYLIRFADIRNSCYQLLRNLVC